MHTIISVHEIGRRFRIRLSSDLIKINSSRWCMQRCTSVQCAKKPGQNPKKWLKSPLCTKSAEFSGFSNRSNKISSFYSVKLLQHRIYTKSVKKRSQNRWKRQWSLTSGYSRFGPDSSNYVKASSGSGITGSLRLTTSTFPLKITSFCCVLSYL